MTVMATAELMKITDTDLPLHDDTQDVRGFKVVDRHGRTIGHVSNLFVDVDERKVRLLEIRTTAGPGFWRHALLPVDVVTAIGAHEISTDQTRDRVDHSPGYSPQLVPLATREFWERFYGHYGVTPTWGAGGHARDR